MGKRGLGGFRIKTFLAIVWFLFTFSLVAWWLIYTLRDMDFSVKTQRMFFWEGTFLIGAILIGGGALIFLSYKDQNRHEQLQTFFQTFSHDIKTSITRLRLQAEVLEEDNVIAKNPVMQRLITDISRLDLQLENSLLLSSTDSRHFLRERVCLSKMIESLRGFWSELEFQLEQDAEIFGDKRALTSILRNLVQNSVMHGQATIIQVKTSSVGNGRVEIAVADNGLGFHGKHEKLGTQMFRSGNDRGNGIGLYLSRVLLKRMNGELHFSKVDPQGLKAVITIEGSIL